MEDMARLALVEQNIKDREKYIKILYELLQLINHILENPHDYELRSIKSGLLKNVLECEAFCEYLKYIGFELAQNEYTYPKTQTLSKLRMSQAAIERKICFCYGPVSHSKPATMPLYQNRASGLTPSNVLETDNPLLRKIEELFNMMIDYEDEKLQEEAREHMPLVTLQLKALDRMREHQKKIKTGEIKGEDLSFDIAVLLELMGWFRYKFFTWVDKPNCEVCGGPTEFSYKETMTTEAETCSVEVYECTRCPGGARFPRHNDARTLLRTRRGRCGEFANCFTLLCRALGYDTRYVYDTTDHVWCEVFDFDTNSWMHVDPCEVKINAPLMYSHGWKKKLCYVIAVSRDDLQDVTWRYTSNHKEVLRRRRLCSERELVAALLRLRARRHAQLSPARRAYLARRTLAELAHLMLERTPEHYEAQGRISGSKAWRTERGEIGTVVEGHTFEFDTPGDYTVEYYPCSDRYVISRDGVEAGELATWAAGVYECERVFRKVESDWQQVYLAREEDATTGSISWKLSAKNDLAFELLGIKVTTAVYETGNIQWTLKFDEQKPITVKLGESAVEYKRSFRSLVVRAALAGGAGGAAWQHAQLFRRALHDDTCALRLQARATAE